MNRLIDADKFCDFLNHYPLEKAQNNFMTFYRDALQHTFECEVDAEPVRHGRWLPILSYNHTYKCSECGRLLVNVTDGLKKVAKNYPYCHCGAKMDGEE